MAQARVINERQKKGTLASLKKTKRPHNILIRNEVEYWPCLEESQREEFAKILRFRFSSAEETSAHLTIGLESTLRRLQAGRVKFLVLANEISPRWFAKHLLASAFRKNPSVKVVIVPKLKELTKMLLKVPAIIFAIDTTASTSDLDEFYKKLGVHDELLKNYMKIESNKDVSIKAKKRKLPEIHPPVVLLKKPSDDSHAFTPIDRDETATVPKSSTTDFIAFSAHTIESSKALSKAPATLSYRPIMIKRVVGNPDRKKK